MNISFIVLGLTSVVGSMLMLERRTKSIQLAWICMALSGAGTILVGLFPENTISAFHIFGAGLAFVLGNSSLIIFGLSALMSKILKVAAVILGLTGLVALILFVSFKSPGTDTGTIERFVAYPQTVWLIIFGFRSFFRLQKRSH